MTTNYFDEAAADWDEKPSRIRLVKAVGEAIVHQAAPTRDMTVLDYGCGTGLLGLYLLPHVRSVTGADNSPGMLQVLNRKIAEGGLNNMRAIRLDLAQDPVPDDLYHMVVTSMVMHHIANPDETLRAFHKMLLPGGILCLADLDTEPGSFHTAEAADSVYHHGFDRGELKARLARMGFSEAKDVTALRYSKPVEKGGEEEFSVFLITARRPARGPADSRSGA
jgi:2-polyprenyl-3-methyl-5-hydroxy-6-metoxy-1,4-benzoquinol methylase